MNTLDFLDRHRIAIVIILCIVSIIFICVGHKYRDEIQLVLKRDLINLPATTIDYWSVMHFALYVIVGFMFPGYPVAALLVGTSFEVGEDLLSSKTNTQFADCNNQTSALAKFWCNAGYDDGYWYMNWSDIFVNLFGYIAGSSLRETFFDKPQYSLSSNLESMRKFTLQ
jgi:hypothetical protein